MDERRCEGRESACSHEQLQWPHRPSCATAADNGRLKFSLRRRRSAPESSVIIESAVNVGIANGKLDGAITRTATYGSANERTRFTGKRGPPMPQSPPDLPRCDSGSPT